MFNKTYIRILCVCFVLGAPIAGYVVQMCIRDRAYQVIENENDGVVSWFIRFSKGKSTVSYSINVDEEELSLIHIFGGDSVSGLAEGDLPGNPSGYDQRLYPCLHAVYRRFRRDHIYDW